MRSRFYSRPVPMGFGAYAVGIAEDVARSGETAIVGRAVTWKSHSPTHMEAVRPTALRVGSVPPPLLREHTRDGDETFGYPLADGVFAEKSARGLDCVWQLRRDSTAVDGMLANLAAGRSGLSINMRGGSIRRDAHLGGFDWRIKHDIVDADVRYVAWVDRPSYPDARVALVVSPRAIWALRDYDTGLLPDDIDAAREDYVAARVAAVSTPAATPAATRARSRIASHHAAEPPEGPLRYGPVMRIQRVV